MCDAQKELMEQIHGIQPCDVNVCNNPVRKFSPKVKAGIGRKGKRWSRVCGECYKEISQRQLYISLANLVKRRF